ncbi:MAG TPA: protein-disulfide reductase DsbD domain-containing protein [Phycisphaerales bacterium]|nr:protein-disulfide reductase DsbD domain-containing protein [Phycisphaerales bacterium]
MPWLLPVVVVAAATSLAALQPATPGNKRKEIVEVSLVARDTSVKPGDTTHVAVVFDIAKDWHIYWPGQNGSGMPTSIQLEFPPGSGFTAGAPAFPLPHRHTEEGDILNYIHEGKVVVTLPIKVPATAKAGQKVPVTAKVEYLVCKTQCQPGDAAVTATITVADKAAANPADAKLVDDALAAQPKPQSDGFDAAATAKWEGDAARADAPQTLVIAAKDAAAGQIAFFPADAAAKLLDPIRAGQVKGNTLRLSFEPGSKPVEGVVVIGTGKNARSWSFSMSRPLSAAPAAVPAAPAPSR